MDGKISLEVISQAEVSKDQPFNLSIILH